MRTLRCIRCVASNGELLRNGTRQSGDNVVKREEVESEDKHVVVTFRGQARGVEGQRTSKRDCCSKHGVGFLSHAPRKKKKNKNAQVVGKYHYGCNGATSLVLFDGIRLEF